MSEKPDWEAIRREYEAGISYGDLAARYGVPKTTIHRRSKKWNGTERNTESGTERNAQAQQNISPIHALRLVPAPSPANAVELANMGLEDLLQLMQKSKGDMDFADHVKASSAMAQYNKIIINALPDDEEHDEEPEDLSGFSEDELRLYAEFQERAKKRA